MREFKAHGFKATSGYSGRAIEVDCNAESARIQYEDGKISKDLEIKYDKNGDAYVRSKKGKEYLNSFMRV